MRHSSASGLDPVLELYTLADAEVDAYLQKRPFLLPVLVELHGQVQKYFGPNTQIVLEVVTDPEGDGERELFAIVQSALPPDEADDRLDRLDHEWWLDQLDRTRGGLTVDVASLSDCD